MTKIKTLLVDDEFLALNLLENFTQRLPDIELIGKVKSPVQALEILQTQAVDLLFLDIQMPTISGTNLLKILPNPPVTIFTTAYAEYATEAFDLNAVDYLLKPFSFERFLQAVTKAKQQLLLKQNSLINKRPSPEITSKPTNNEQQFITIKVEGNLQKIYLEDIIYIEGLREYVRFVCEDKKKYVTLESLKNLEELLPESTFMRVHKSYIAAIQKATKLTGNLLEIGGYHIPTSRSKKEEIIQTFF